MYKTGGGTFCPKTTIVDEKIVALLTPQFKPLPNELDSSAPYYNLDIETQVVSEDAQVGTPQDIFVVLDAKEDSVCDIQSTSKEVECRKRPILPVGNVFQDVESTPKLKKKWLTETKKRNINNLSASIIKRKNLKQMNEDAITTERLKILEIQRQQELIKLEKTKILLDIDIELKRTLLENAKMDLEYKEKNFSL
ncbi:unnamed protein product [Arctia plantaginis]|nr:unnamed protein product [Arctia plantaginis]